MIPDDVRARAEARLTEYCDQRIPRDVQDKIRLEWRIRGASATITERRPHFMRRSEWTRSPVAQFRFDPESGKWTLYCADRNSRWHVFTPTAPSRNLDDLLRAVDADRTAIFWG
jgi:hypothetical protein